MGAGRQRWWRDHRQECAAWTGDAPASAWGILCETESGIAVRVRLWLTHPVVYATFRVD